VNRRPANARRPTPLPSPAGSYLGGTGWDGGRPGRRGASCWRLASSGRWVGRRQAWEARRELLEAGIIRQAGTCGSGALFLPVDPQATESRRGGVRVAHAMVV